MSDVETPPPLTETEETAVERFEARRSGRAPLIGIKVKGKEGAATQIHISHRDATKAETLLCDQFGTDTSEFASLMVEQLAQLSVIKDAIGNESVSDHVTNAHIAIVRGIQPRDEVEAMLAVQMAAIHMLTMGEAATAYRADNTERKEIAVARINKLTRTYTTQMEALKRYRSKGDQKVTVEHVHVHEGGQAVVGNVTQNREG